MKKAICKKNDKIYSFNKEKIYNYYTIDKINFYVFNRHNHRCSFTKKTFNEHFIDYKKLRKEKLKKYYGL